MAPTRVMNEHSRPAVREALPHAGLPVEPVTSGHPAEISTANDRPLKLFHGPTSTTVASQSNPETPKRRPPRELSPRGRLLDAGPEALSSAELVAVLLGGEERSALATAVRLLEQADGLGELLRTTSAAQLAGEVGISEARACTLVAAAEIGRRLAAATAGPVRPVISSPNDVDALLRPRLAHLDREHFVVVLLNTKNRVISTLTISIGTLSSSVVHPREVFKPAVKASAASVILVHNHPSLDTTPSGEDVAVTRRLVEAGGIFGIEVLDHIIIGETFHSFKEHGRL